MHVYNIINIIYIYDVQNEFTQYYYINKFK